MSSVRVDTLVIGASGFLGAHVVLALARTVSPRRDGARTGGEILGAARRPELGPASEVPSASLDATDPAALAALLQRADPRAVVCAAALARAADCERDPRRAAELNVDLPARLAHACARAGRRLVHVSTDLVFAGSPPSSTGYAESDPAEAPSVYGRTKAAGERAVLAACPSAVVVRLPLLYGPSHGRGLGATDSLLQAVARAQQPALFVDEWRTPLDVRDAACSLAELALRTDITGLLHVAGPERLSRHELGLVALRAAGHAPDRARALVRAVRQQDVAAGAPRPADVSLDSTRARALLATPLRTPREALADGA